MNNEGLECLTSTALRLRSVLRVWQCLFSPPCRPAGHPHAAPPIIGGPLRRGDDGADGPAAARAALRLQPQLVFEQMTRGGSPRPEPRIYFRSRIEKTRAAVYFK